MKQEFVKSNQIPTEDRSCTDIICCLLFFIGLIGFVVLFGVAVG